MVLKMSGSHVSHWKRNLEGNLILLCLLESEMRWNTWIASALAALFQIRPSHVSFISVGKYYEIQKKFLLVMSYTREKLELDCCI